MNLIKALLSQSDASGSRSTILRPLTWLLGILFFVLLTLLYMNAPNWLCYILVGIILVIIVLFIFTYIFCLFKDRDALRSESFSIRKLQIEKGIFGDNNTGYLPNEQNQGSLPYSNNEEDSL